MTIDIVFDLRADSSTFDYYRTMLRAPHVNIGTISAIVAGVGVSYFVEGLLPMFYANVAAVVLYVVVILPTYYRIAERLDKSAVNQQTFRLIVLARLVIFALLGFDCVIAFRSARVST